MNLPNQIASARVLVGESVYEDATLTVRDGTLFVEFEAQDLDSLAIPLSALSGPDPDALGGVQGGQS